MKQLRGLAVKSAGKYREEKWQGRDYLVVPVVALVEGVIHAMNAPNPELVMAEEFSKQPQVWNGRPVFVGHPMRNGSPVSGNSPEVLEKESVGIVFNAAVRKNKLTMEAWVDVDKCEQVNPALLQRIRDEDPIEISVGTFVETDDVTGEYEGTPYVGRWHDLGPDHLALLPEGDVGACSREMGCGVRAAQKGEAMYGEWLVAGAETDALLKTLRNIPQSVRDKMPAEDFAGKNRSFPIEKPVDVSDAAKAIGRAGPGNYSSDELKKRIIAIAYRKGGAFVDALPDSWKKKKDQKNASALTRMLAMFRGAISTTESDRDQRQALLDAIRAMEPNVYDIVAMYSDRVVYPVYENGCSTLYQRAYTGDEASGYTVDGNRVEVEPAPIEYIPVVAEEHDGAPTDAVGKAISADNMKRIQAMHDQSVALGAECSGMKAASSCGCQKQRANEENKVMEKTERIKALRAAHKPFTDEDQKVLEKMDEKHLLALETVVKANQPETTALVFSGIKTAMEAAEAEAQAQQEKDKDKNKPEAKKDEPAAAAAAKAPTFAEVLGTADQVTRDAINEGLRVGKLRREQSIKALKDSKRCDISDERLAKMSQAELDELVKLAEVKVAVDYSGMGVSRNDGDKPEGVPKPQNMNERILARAAAAKK